MDLASDFIQCELEEEALVLALRTVRQWRAELEEARDSTSTPGGPLAIANEQR